MKKVLHVGITAPTYSSDAIEKSFKDVFGDVMYYDWQAARFNLGTELMRTDLLKTAHAYSPDIIFLHFNHNSEALSIDNYEELSKIGFTVSYTEDVRHDISWFEKITPILGLSVFTNVADVEKLKLLNINNTLFMPVSYNDLWYKKQPKTEKKYGEIVFLGNNYVNTNLDFPKSSERQLMCDALHREFGRRFQSYGNGQKNKMLNPQEAVECYNNATIAITQNNFTRRGYQSDRGLNSMGCGCATVMQYYDGIENDFPNLIGGNWKSIEELIFLCNLYTESNGKWIRNQLAHYQYETVTTQHTWIKRAQELQKTIKNILDGQS